MRISEQWLREWVDPALDTAALAGQLTMAGLEVDSVEPAAPAFTGVVVGRIESVEPHPDARKLRVCRVDAGGETLQIVCGAPNVRPGMHAPLARVGARLPGGTEIRAAALRGVDSAGMLCSARELGLGEGAEGLMDLGPQAEPGTDLRAALGLDDRVIEVDLTPNRGDCLSMAGVAREVATLNRLPVTGPAVDPVPAEIEDVFPVALEAPSGCPRYVGRVIRDIDPSAPTPLWMQERLRRAGLRSLGPLVDVTNYVMLELGQPMHAFDLERLEGGIRVRESRAGERLVLLDETELALEQGGLLIADEARPLALAGIMGGLASGVGEDTRHLFLESAFFSPLAVAGKARGYGLATESSRRFERGVDPGGQERAVERATALLLAICGGRPGPVIRASDPTHLPEPAAITLRRARIRRVLGVDLDDAEIEQVLERLGMALEAAGEGWRVTAPAFRFDVTAEIDLIEELARVHGYAAIPGTRPAAPLAVPAESETRLELDRLTQVLIERGYREAVTYSFVDPELQRRLDPEGEDLALANPISSEMAVMRRSTWPGLLQALRHNLNRQQERVRLFETGLCFAGAGADLLQEPRLGGLLTGTRLPLQWGAPAEPVDFFDAKGDVEALLRLSGEPFALRPESHPALHPGQSARILRGGREIGWLGALHPAHEAALDIDRHVLLFELRLADLAAARLPRFEELSRFPAIRRDIAVEVDESVPAGEVLAAVRAAEPASLKTVILFDVYRGKGVTPGRKSLALGLILQDLSRTLTEDEVNAAQARILADLATRTGATLRE